MLTKSSGRWRTTSPTGTPVTKPMVQVPACGHCPSTASRKALPLLENKVSDTCFTEL